MDGEIERLLQSKKVGTLIGEVHSVFERVVNVSIINEDRFIAIARGEVIQSPDMMKTRDDELFYELCRSLKPSDKIYLLGFGKLGIGRFVLDYKNAKKWGARIPQLPCDFTKVDELIVKIDHFLLKQGKVEGILRAYQQKHSLGDRKEIKLTIHQRAQTERLKLVKHDGLPDQLKGFIGLGVGLTPSGDDFLTGLFAVWHAHRGNQLDLILYEQQEWLDYIKSYTTTVSYHMLKNGLNGSFNNALKQILLKGEKLEQEDLEEMLKIGSTSGTDMLIGVVEGYRMLSKIYKQGGNEYGI